MHNLLCLGCVLSLATVHFSTFFASEATRVVLDASAKTLKHMAKAKAMRQRSSHNSASMLEKENASATEVQEGHFTTRSKFEYQCGIDTKEKNAKEKDAACQGCFAASVAMIQSWRFANPWDGDDRVLHQSLVKTTTKAEDQYSAFCQTVVEGKKEGPNFCKKHLQKSCTGVFKQGVVVKDVQLLNLVAPHGVTGPADLNGINIFCTHLVKIECQCKKIWSQLRTAVHGDRWILPTAQLAYTFSQPPAVSNLQFHCGLQSNMQHEVDCQACFAQSIAYIQASRPICDQGTNQDLYNTFLDGYTHGTAVDKTYEFCNKVVDGQAAETIVCQKFFWRNYKGYPSGDRAVQDSVQAVADAAEAGETDPLNGLNALCRTSMKSLVNCQCQLWPKLILAAGGPDWIVPTAQCRHRKTLAEKAAAKK